MGSPPVLHIILVPVLFIVDIRDCPQLVKVYVIQAVRVRGVTQDTESIITQSPPFGVVIIVLLNGDRYRY